MEYRLLSAYWHAPLLLLAVLGLSLAATASHARSSETTPIQADSTAVIDASDYSSLQEALDAVPANGGLVQLPPGRFSIEKPLRVRTGDTRIVGQGAATHIVNKNTTGEPAFLVGSDAYLESGNSSDRIWRIQFADFRISGNEASGDGIRAMGINEIYIQGMSIDHNGGHGIALMGCYENPRVNDGMITYNAESGLHVHQSHDIVVNGNHFEENRDGVHVVDSFNLTMNGNNIDDHLRHGVVIHNTYGSVVSGNMIEQSQGYGMVLDSNTYGTSVSGNTFANDLKGGVDLRDAWGITVSSNMFTRLSQHAVRVRETSGRITITGNNFSNSFIGGKRLREEDPATGIVLENTTDIAITGNTFTGLQKEAVRTVGSSTGVTLVGNVMRDLSRAQPGAHSAHTVGGDSTAIDLNITP